MVLTGRMGCRNDWLCIIRSVYVKAQRHSWAETDPGDPTSDDMLNNITDCEKWKNMRSCMSPTFSSGSSSVWYHKSANVPNKWSSTWRKLQKKENQWIWRKFAPVLSLLQIKRNSKDGIVHPLSDVANAVRRTDSLVLIETCTCAGIIAHSAGKTSQWMERRYHGSELYYRYLRKKASIEAMKGHLEKFGDTYGSYGGRMPVVVTIDFDIIRSVYVKDTETFVSRNRFVTGDPTSDDMLNNITDYEKWKNMRSIMSPTFSSGKLKRMVPQISKCAEQMVKHLEKAAKEGKSVDMKEVCSFYTMDAIATTAFGIDLDSKQDENSDFIKYAKMAFHSLGHPVMIIIFFFPFLYPLLPYMKLK